MVLREQLMTLLVGLALGLATLGACGASSTDNDGSGGSTSDPVLDSGQCRTHDDCTPGTSESCIPPGQPNCGACLPPQYPCSVDGDCDSVPGPTKVCGPMVSDCKCGDGECTAACKNDLECPTLAHECGGDGHCTIRTCAVDYDCGLAGVVCLPTGHCVERECGIGMPCELDFECTDAYQCEPLACTSDADCEGTCVLSSCYYIPGSCQEPPP